MAAEEAPPMALNYIPEVVLKKRKNNEEWAIRRKLQLQERVKRLESQKFDIKKPEQFIREFRDKIDGNCPYSLLSIQELDLRGRRQRRRAPATFDSKLLFIIRIGGKNDMHPQTRKLLHYLRLRKIFSGVFVKANERLMEILQKVEPYVTYGYPNLKSVKDLIYKKGVVKVGKQRIPLTGSYPNLKSVKDLIYKKGVVKVGKQRIPLTDNNIFEQELGQHNTICIEDIVAEIANVSTHFKAVTNFIRPFV